MEFVKLSSEIIRDSLNGSKEKKMELIEAWCKKMQKLRFNQEERKKLFEMEMKCLNSGGSLLTKSNEPLAIRSIIEENMHVFSFNLKALTISECIYLNALGNKLYKEKKFYLKKGVWELITALSSFEGNSIVTLELVRRFETADIPSTLLSSLFAHECAIIDLYGANSPAQR